MSTAWREVTEELARSRNLRIMIARVLAKQGYFDIPNVTYDIFEIGERFCFSKRDIKYRVRDFFKQVEGRYTLNVKTSDFLQKALLAHQKARPLLKEAEVVFLKTFGRFSDGCKEAHYYFDYNQLNDIYGKLHDVITVLHWGRLPILNKYLMINSSRIPEDNVIDFYDHYDMLYAMLKDIRGEGECMTTKGDETLDKKMTFSVYTRRWGHNDTYRVQRTVDGWNVGHIAIGGACEKDGTRALFQNLNHDSVFYPEDGIKYAMTELWEQADEGTLTLDELQVRLQQIADWISMVEKAVGEGQPDWARYY